MDIIPYNWDCWRCLYFPLFLVCIAGVCFGCILPDSERHNDCVFPTRNFTDSWGTNIHQEIAGMCSCTFLKCVDPSSLLVWNFTAEHVLIIIEESPVFYVYCWLVFFISVSGSNIKNYASCCKGDENCLMDTYWNHIWENKL